MIHKRADERTWLPLLAAAATGIFVGSTIVATRFVIAQTTPATLAFLRYAIGFCCLLPVTLLTNRRWFASRDLLPIALLGITQFGILIALLNYGAQYIPAARSALIFATMPLMTMILGAVLGHEEMTLAKTVGVLASIFGVALALGGALRLGSTPQELWGAGAVLLGTLSGAVCSILYRPYLQRYPTLLVSTFAMAASVLFLALLAAGEGLFQQPLYFTSGGWLAVGFIGVSSGIGYYLWLWALNHAATTRVTIFLALSPVTATGLGALLLHESVSTTFGLGVACVVGGLWLAHRQPVQHTQPATHVIE
ncbi:MAG: DMT family transporter [Caldilineaceae bacterium]